VDFSYSGLSSLLEVATLLKELIGSEVPVWIRKVSGNFKCNGNRLTDLKGAPQYVGGSFGCSYNQLVSLAGAPRRVEGNFDCRFNHLQTLQGAPEWVGGNFVCIFNELVSLEGAPKYVGGEFYCCENTKKFTEEEVRKLVNVKGKVWTDIQ
jgi:hypothetical protein